MNAEDQVKKFSPTMDSKSMIIDDIAPDQVIKVYPYVLPNTAQGESFMDMEATSIVFYTQTGMPTDGLQQDEDGNWYFTMLPDQTTITDVTLAGGVSNYHKELTEVVTFQGLANFYPDKTKKNLSVGQGQALFNLLPYVFSFGAPLNEDLYDAHVQPLFVSSSMVAAKDSESDLAFEVNQEGLYEISFINVSSFEQAFENSSVMFRSVDTKRINTLDLVLPVNSLFGGVAGKAYTSSGRTDVSFSEAKRYPIWNAAPITIDDRIEMFTKWADAKMILPMHIIQKFKNQQPLSKLFKDDTDAWLTDGEELFHLLKDMLLYTKLYVDQWKDIQQVDKLSDATNSNYGQIKINVTVGSNNAPATYKAGKRVINLVIGKAPAEVVESLYESFLNDKPEVDQGTLTIFKAAVVALSRYIRTENLALAGGLNDFNSIYLPWRLKTSNKISITREAVDATFNYSIKEDPLVIFDSHWFEFDVDKIVAKKINNLYETQLIQSERNITQPIIPAKLSEVSISANPGGVSQSDANQLSYNWWIPTQEQKVFDTLMLKDLTTTVTDAQEQTLNDRTARVTDQETVDLINEIKTVLAGKTLGTDWASEPQDVKDALSKWYRDHIETKPGSGLAVGITNFFAIFGPLMIIRKAEDAIIKSSGYDKDELETFGVTGANWLDTAADPAQMVWGFMKVIQDGFDTTGFDTINHTEQWNGTQFSGLGMSSLTNPVENWMREIKGSWLNKYLTDEAGLRAFLFDQAVSLLTAFNHPSWDTRAHQIPEADFLKFFPGLKGNMVFTQFELRINGYINGDYTGDREGYFYPNPLVPGKSKLKLERAQAIIKIEIIEKNPVIFPNAVHFKLKNGVTQSFDLSTNRKLIFTKDEWHNLIRAIKPENYYEEISLTPIKGDDLNGLKELTVVSLWANNIVLLVNGDVLEIPSINAFDETLVKHKIIFT